MRRPGGKLDLARGPRVRAAARRALALALFLGLAAAGPPARSDDPEPGAAEPDLVVTGRGDPSGREAGASSGLPPRDVGLDRLLKLPGGMDFESEKRGGHSESQWRSRFRESRGEIQAAESALAETRAALDKQSGGGGGNWQMAPPGASVDQLENTPVSFKLREEMRRGKERLEEAERAHRALEIEADLADVPLAWREG